MHTKTAPAPADPTHLPNPKHTSRVPLNISAEQLGRIRQSAFALPQVVKPADYVTEGSKGFELHLDKLGFVLLQKPVSGARPSRWIEPALMASAVAHLDTLGVAATTPEARLLMVERTAALEGLGLTRRAGQWTRLVSHTLALSETAWQVPVLFRVDVDATPVWDYYRTSDSAALQLALGPVPPYPHAAELQAHLARLVARSEALQGTTCSRCCRGCSRSAPRRSR